MKDRVACLLMLSSLLLFVGCRIEREGRPMTADTELELTSAAQSERQWTGVTVSQAGRMFVNWPRWSDNVPVSVAEVTAAGPQVPFPNKEWNSWTPDKDPRNHWVCVQSVYCDDQGMLWVLDPANPRFKGVVEGGPKLVKIDLDTNKVVKNIPFDKQLAPENSYLNDVRVDTINETAYISESGTGAIIVVDLDTEKSRRVLADHPSTKSEGVEVTIAGTPWRRADGSKPDVHCDGIALHPSRDYVYYQALTGRHLYRIATRALRDDKLSATQLAGKVERVAETFPVDGIMFDREARLYLSALEDNAVKRLTPKGEIQMVVRDERIRWPDTFAIGPEGRIYFTTSQIHLMPAPGQPFHVFRFEPPR